MVATIHQALVVDAVVDSEHVTGFVGEHLCAAPEELGGAGFAVSGETVDACPISEGGLTEDEIPFRVGIKIRHRHPEPGVGIFGKIFP